MAKETDVLIVGAGPTGLVLALWLTHLGVRVRIVDKTAQPGTTSRALVMHARILEQYIDVRRVFHLVCSDENRMMERLRRRALKENRLDDASDEVIRRRWLVYEEESRPVLGFYPAALVQAVDALKTPIQVLHTVLGHLIDAPVA